MKFNHSHASHHRRRGGRFDDGAGCLIVVVLLAIMVGGGLIGMLVSGTDWYGAPWGSHDELTSKSTCGDWNAERGGFGEQRRREFIGNHTTQSAVKYDNVTTFCALHPGDLLIDSLTGRIFVFDPVKNADVPAVVVH